MTIQELEQLIEGQEENQSLDFKRDCPWDAKTMAKDFIAMANVQNGGYIIIGVREEANVFHAEGVSTINLLTYELEKMQDKLGNFADPPVEFKVSKPSDSKGRKYVVIKVFPFKEIPIFSKTDSSDLTKGILYYRNTNGRVQSGPISNPNDLRDIIERAALILMKKRKSLGYIVESTENETLIQELKTIPETDFLNKIKSRGYWEFLIQPLETGNIAKLPDCLYFVRNAQVTSHWPFPQIPSNHYGHGSVHPSENCYESEFINGSRIEFWRMYKSEQFIMLSALVEDWYEEDKFRGEELREKYVPGRFISYGTSILFPITQFITFVSKLMKQGLFNGGVKISATLYNTRDRNLNLEAIGRIQFEDKITKAPKIKVEKNYTKDQLTENSLEISNEFILEIFENFGYHPSAESVLKEQEEFLFRT